MPKTPSHALFDLVQSMTAAEKRHFKMSRSPSAKEGELAYLHLFDILAEMSAYDESFLRQKLTLIGEAKHLAYKKSHLYQLLLESLRIYHRKSSKEMEVLNLLQDIRITFDRGLFAQSEALLKKLRKKCIRYKLFEQLVPAIYWSFRLVDNMTHAAMRSSMNYETASRLREEVWGEMSGVLENLHLQADLWKLRTDLRDMYSFGRISLAESGVLERLELIKGKLPREELNIVLQSRLLDVETLLCVLRKDFEGSAKLQEEHLQIWESAPELLRIHLNTYLSMINNHLVALLKLHRHESAHHWIQKLRAYLDDPDLRQRSYLHTRAFAFYQVNLLRYHNLRQEFEAAASAMDTERFQNLRSGMNPYKAFQIQYNLIIAYFFSGRYSSALRWINHLLHAQVEVLSSETSFVRELKYLIHYRRGNIDLLEGSYHSQDKAFQKMLTENPAERALLEGLFRLVQGRESAKEELIASYGAKLVGADQPRKLLLAYIQERL